MAFHEKKADAPTMPGRPDMVLASMGNYVFSADLLLKMVNEDAEDESSTHDFGTDILPKMIHETQVFAYDFSTNRIPGELPGREAYWRDVGTIDAFYEANMDIRSHDPALNLYNRQWPLRTASYATPPVKFEYTDEGRQGVAIDSMVSSGCIISGSRVQDSILGRNVIVQDGAVIEDSVIFDSCTIGRNSKIRKAIIEKNINLPEDTVIGHDADADRQKYVVTDSGIVVVEGYRSPVDVSVINI
jgi:glucose-1-phosphate adenylyltransferase